MMRRSMDRVERSPATTIALIGCLFALAYGASLVVSPKPNGRIVVGDAVHYYVYLRSLVFDGDLQFHNEYVRLYGLTHRGPEVAWVYDPLPSGYIRNVMPIGTAIAWAPLYLIVTGVLSLLRTIGVAVAVDGYGRLFQATAGFSGIAAATVGAWLAYRAAAAMFGVRPAIWATLAIWLGASPLYYSLVSPTYSHAVSMLANGAAIVYWLETRSRTDVARFAVLGALIGCATLVRWQEATLLALPVIDALRLTSTGIARRTAPRRSCDCAGRRRRTRGARRVHAPDDRLELVLRGTIRHPAGRAVHAMARRGALGAVLFSDWHGLFTWTPIVLLSVSASSRSGGGTGTWRRPSSCSCSRRGIRTRRWPTGGQGKRSARAAS